MEINSIIEIQTKEKTLNYMRLTFSNSILQQEFLRENYSNTKLGMLVYLILAIISGLCSICLLGNMKLLIKAHFACITLNCLLLVPNYYIDKFPIWIFKNRNISKILIVKLMTINLSLFVVYVSQDLFIFNLILYTGKDMDLFIVLIISIVTILRCNILILVRIEFRFAIPIFVLRVGLFKLVQELVFDSASNYMGTALPKYTFIIWMIVCDSLIKLLPIYYLDFFRKINFEERFDMTHKKRILDYTINHLNGGVLILNDKCNILYLNKFMESIGSLLYHNNPSTNHACNPARFREGEINENLIKAKVYQASEADNSKQIMIGEYKTTEKIMDEANLINLSRKHSIKIMEEKSSLNDNNPIRSTNTVDKRYAEGRRASYFMNHNSFINKDIIDSNTTQKRKESMIKPVSPYKKSVSSISEFCRNLSTSFFQRFEDLSNNIPLEIIEAIRNSDESVEKNIRIIQLLLQNENFFNESKFLGVLKIERLGRPSLRSVSEDDPDSSFKFFEVSVKTIKLPGSEPLVEFFFTDITRYRIIEKEKALVKSKTAFMAKIAHEFKNPLICIAELTGQMRESLDKEKNENEIELRRSSTNRLSTQVDEMKPLRSCSYSKLMLPIRRIKAFQTSTNVNDFSNEVIRHKKRQRTCHLGSSPLKAKILKEQSSTQSPQRRGNFDDNEKVNEFKVNLLTIKSLSSYIISLVFDFEVLAKKESSSQIQPLFRRSDLNKEIEFLQELSVILLKKISLRVKFCSEIDRRLPKTILTDSLRLRQIMVNLISNSIKFTQFGYIKLIIKRSEHKTIQFIVEDTGSGIKNPDLLFHTSFMHQGNNNTYGTGLGLIIVKDLCNCIGGKIRFENNQPKGSRFIVEIPCIEEGSKNSVNNEIKPKTGEKDSINDCKNYFDDMKYFGIEEKESPSNSNINDNNSEDSEEKYNDLRSQFNEISLSTNARGRMLRAKSMEFNHSDQRILFLSDEEDKPFQIDYQASKLISDLNSKKIDNASEKSTLRVEIPNDETLAVKKLLSKQSEPTEDSATTAAGLNLEPQIIFKDSRLDSKIKPLKKASLTKAKVFCQSFNNKSKGNEHERPISDSETKQEVYLTPSLFKRSKIPINRSSLRNSESRRKASKKNIKFSNQDESHFTESKSRPRIKGLKSRLKRRKSCLDIRLNSDLSLVADINSITIKTNDYTVTETKDYDNNEAFNGNDQSVFNTTTIKFKKTILTRDTKHCGKPKQICILVVDDERIIRQSTSKLIESYFTEFFTDPIELLLIEASDGIECLYAVYLANIQNVTINYIFTDDSMRFMSGCDFASLFQRLIDTNKLEEANVCVVSAYDKQEIKKRYPYKCIKEIFSKPISKLEIKHLKLI